MSPETVKHIAIKNSCSITAPTWKQLSGEKPAISKYMLWKLHPHRGHAWVCSLVTPGSLHRKSTKESCEPCKSSDPGGNGVPLALTRVKLTQEVGPVHFMLGKQYLNKILLEKEISHIPRSHRSGWVPENQQLSVVLWLGRGSPHGVYLSSAAPARAPGFCLTPCVGSTWNAGGQCGDTQQGSEIFWR